MENLWKMEPEMLGKWLKQISLVFQEKIIHARYQSTNSFIVQAKEYVKNHYDEEDLSLDLCMSGVRSFQFLFFNDF